MLKGHVSGLQERLRLGLGYGCQRECARLNRKLSQLTENAVWNHRAARKFIEEVMDDVYCDDYDEGDEKGKERE